MLAQSDTVQAGAFDVLPHTIADCLSTLPGFQASRPQAEGVYEHKRRLAVAFYRLYLPGTQEEWFLLRYDSSRDVLLCLRRIGRDSSKSELRVLSPDDLDAVRGPGGARLVFDAGWSAVSVKLLLR